jgi:N-acetylglucosaminyl-diphospho-decaprenol L-rhamnosyltransferase
VSNLDGFRVAILIVGFRNPQDVQACVSALSRSGDQPSFDVFICENGGSEAFRQVCDALVDPHGPCQALTGALPDPISRPSGRLLKIECFALKHKDSRVWIGSADQNLGYAGGVNVWLERLLPVSDFQGFWIVNPDAEPEPGALRALVERSLIGNKGMVGSTIVTPDRLDYVYCRAGHRWRKLRTSLALLGLGQPMTTPIDLPAIEATLDSISGASTYVSRSCVRDIGLMDERFFLYYEDADWSARAKKHGLGYAPDSIVPHRGGTTIGSAQLRAQRSRLSVYLESRNHLHFVRIHWFGYLPLAIMFGCLHAALFLPGSPKNARAAVAGMLAALKGETGQPQFHEALTNSSPRLVSDNASAANQGS